MPSARGNAAASQGELHLTGKGIKRLVLDRRNHGKILLESPESVVLLPEGEYRWESVTLQGNGGTTFSAGNSRRQWDTRDARSTAIMNVGGPLEPLLTVDEGRGKLILMHKLRGIDGELYLADRFSVHP
ncbi:MAG TPA: hypothetical protein PL151_14235 [Phycisphaerae bacterium]|nr:hypothetical protein [Phycisphaerae bacterium]HOJ75313.1 hypothetical protein [Phycisphaerae bacterium]HOM53022.1 hypothetical protein [Phycisphaerae bacterium]HOQ87203.1 hypothetical protein [Phycisphaerae bacterium]HPP28185.1 hypothetical protein [Phycisphaerae bacterium]